MDNKFFESKKAYMDRTQKKLNKVCFKNCFDHDSLELNKDCFLICYDKYIKSSRIIFNFTKNITKLNKSKYYYKIFYKKNPFFLPIYSQDIYGYSIQKPFLYTFDYMKEEKI